MYSGYKSQYDRLLMFFVYRYSNRVFQSNLFFDGFGQAGKEPYSGKILLIKSSDTGFYPGKEPIINF